LGKLKTALQMVTIIIILLNNLPFELWYLPVDEILIWFTSFISVAGGYSYFMQVRDYIFESM
ncbi:MAG: CDP-diacylglycerol--glycerol-3-phosphate 3-phosphatidyltransferase, partial [Erysipelotrichaceae bacterium]|nr:CDP-diacylglycerol--glycerol-3-phosphate 3-phosphatidyltransferase [Erysipelotrichaceae bacterium]